MAQGESVPTRFDETELAILKELKERTGFSRSELVRRAVRLLRHEVARRGPAFILEDLAPGASRQSQSQSQYQQTGSARFNEEPPKT